MPAEPAAQPDGAAAPAPPPLVPEGATVAAYPHADRIPAAIHGPDSSLRGIVVCVTGLGVSG